MLNNAIFSPESLYERLVRYETPPSPPFLVASRPARNLFFYLHQPYMTTKEADPRAGSRRQPGCRLQSWPVRRRSLPAGPLHLELAPPRLALGAASGAANAESAAAPHAATKGVVGHHCAGSRRVLRPKSKGGLLGTECRLLRCTKGGLLRGACRQRSGAAGEVVRDAVGLTSKCKDSFYPDRCTRASTSCANMHLAAETHRTLAGCQTRKPAGRQAPLAGCQSRKLAARRALQAGHQTQKLAVRRAPQAGRQRRMPAARRALQAGCQNQMRAGKRVRRQTQTRRCCCQRRGRWRVPQIGGQRMRPAQRRCCPSCLHCREQQLLSALHLHVMGRAHIVVCLPLVTACKCNATHLTPCRRWEHQSRRRHRCQT